MLFRRQVPRHLTVAAKRTFSSVVELVAIREPDSFVKLTTKSGIKQDTTYRGVAFGTSRFCITFDAILQPRCFRSLLRWSSQLRGWTGSPELISVASVCLRLNLRCRPGQDSFRTLDAMSTASCMPSFKTASETVRLSA